MRRISLAFTSLFTSSAILFAALVITPAHADDSVVTVDCSTGTYTLTTVGSVVTVSAGGSCTGDVVIPEGITAIAQYAFLGAQLTSISLPMSLSRVGDSPFYGTRKLTQINVSALNPDYISVDGVLYGRDVTAATLIAYPANKDVVTYTTPISVLYGDASQTPVKSISTYAFQGAQKLTTLTISEGVTTLGSGVFESANLLSVINLPDSYTKILGRPFGDAIGLTSIIIKASVTEIGERVFNHSRALSSFYFLGDEPTTVDINAFVMDNDGLITPGAKAYKKTGAIGFNLDGTGKWRGLEVSTFAYVNYNSKGGSAVSVGTFEVGGSISAPTAPTRDGYGFAGWSATDGGTAVAFPYTPTSLSDITLFANWFQDGNYLCSSGVRTDLTTNIFSVLGGVVTGGTCAGPMVIPAGVTSIGRAAFQDVVTLTSITFSGTSTLETIGVNAFFRATGLASVAIPDGVTSIGETAFWGTSSLTSVTFDGDDTSPPLNIGNGAFYNAIKLTSISIPKNVTSIGNNAFDTTTSLTSVTFAEGSLLTSIGNSAFAFVPILTSITIPENVESIGTNAFEEATSLASINFLGNAPTVGDNAFFGISAEPKAYIEPGATGFDLDEITGKWNGLTVITVYTYTLTYNYNSATGGNSTASGSFITGGTAITLPTPTRTGYAFAGWYSDSSFVNKIGNAGADYSPTGVDDSLTAYAKWTANTYTLTYNYNSATGGNSTASGSFTTGGTAITLPTPTRTGYAFAGWYSDSGFVNKIGNAGAGYSPTGTNRALNAYAKWTEIPVLPETPPSGNPQADNTPPVDLVAQAAAADLAARTIKVKSKFAIKSLAQRIGVKTVSPKAKITLKISKASKKVCTKSGSKIKTLNPGNCVVTFTVQEPNPKKSKKPKATKTVKTLVVN